MVCDGAPDVIPLLTFEHWVDVEVEPHDRRISDEVDWSSHPFGR